MTNDIRNPFSRGGFTLIEIMVVVAIVGLIAAAVLVAADPVRRVAESRNARRSLEAYSIKEAVLKYSLDHDGLPSGIDDTLRMIGTESTGCAVTCGETLAFGEAPSAPVDLAAKTFTAITEHLLAAFSSPALAADPPPETGWISPDGDQEPTGQWSNPASARDGNLNTYATNTYGGTGWGEYIFFTLATPTYSDRVRLYADYMDAHIQQVQVDVLKDGAWVNVYAGGNELDWNCKWFEVSYLAGTVEQARFRYNYKVGGYHYWLYEFQFYKASVTVTPPACSSRNADLIQDVAATLHANVINDGGTPSDWMFRYGPTAAYGLDTGWTAGAVSGGTLSKFVNGLTPSMTYHFGAVLRNSAGQVDCGDTSFTTKPPLTGWVSPSGYSDLSGTWLDGLSATDQSTDTYARAYHNIGDAQWSAYLYLDHAEIQSDSVRFIGRGPAEVGSVDVEVLKDGAWTSVYQGSFNNLQWYEYSFAMGNVTQARVRFLAANASSGFYFQLNEFQFLRASEGTKGACLDLSGLTPKYLATVPVDPENGTPSHTRYAIKRVNTNSVMVYACGAELGADIHSTR